MVGLGGIFDQANKTEDKEDYAQSIIAIL